MAPGLLLSIAVYAGALKTFFAQDDITFLSRAAGLEPWDWRFRPLSAGLFFRLEHGLFGLDPFGYHLVNLLFHLVNVALIYALAVRLHARRGTAAAAAVLFGASSIAFTPIHWATGIIELLTCAILLGATLLWIESRRRGMLWRWTAALVALAAMFSKETAVAWLLAVAVIQWRLGRGNLVSRSLLPATVAVVAFVLIFLATGQGRRLEISEAYASTASPLFIAQNLFTYLRWSVALNEPIRDIVAAADPAAWRIGLPLALALGVALWRQRHAAQDLVVVGTGWWLAFLLPVLPLAHHTYLYYLYIPWVGGALALAGLGQALLSVWSRQAAIALSLTLIGGYALLEGRNVEVRRTATRDALPVDRTIRDAVLLSHALPALQNAALPPGTRVAFVNPVPRARFDVMTGSPTRPEDQPNRTSYFPLEGAMRGGETLRLFVPGLVYLGFTRTIPREWEDAECFYFEQRGWLAPWGRGQSALMHQAKVQMASRQWAAADSTLRRVRARGDTLPEALQWQVTALTEAGRTHQARLVAEEFARRWPTHRSIPVIHPITPDGPRALPPAP